jgi:acetyltransferase-like isoleucine patch superfamily enzyme
LERLRKGLSKNTRAGVTLALAVLTKYFAKLFLVGYRVSNRFRARCFARVVSGAFAQFGREVSLNCPVRLSGESRIAIGDGVYIGAGSWLQALPDGDNESVAISIGSETSIAGFCVISAVRKVVVEDNVLIARNVYISDHIHKYSQVDIPIHLQGVDKVGPVVVKHGSWLGQNVVVCPGVTIGIGSVVGANSVVTRDVPDFSVAVGAPASVVKTIERQVIELVSSSAARWDESQNS